MAEQGTETEMSAFSGGKSADETSSVLQAEKGKDVSSPCSTLSYVRKDWLILNYNLFRRRRVRSGLKLKRWHSALANPLMKYSPCFRPKTAKM